MSQSYLLVIGDAAALTWVLTEQRMAFPLRRRAEVAALDMGDELLVYTTRGCFGRPAYDPGRVMGLATVKTKVSDLAEPVVFGERQYPSGCALEFQGVAAVHEGVELRLLVPELHVFPDPTSWSAWLRRPLLRMDAHDSARVKRDLNPLLQPVHRHLDAYIQASEQTRLMRRRQRRRLRTAYA
jgi:hypothetical protein